MGQTIYWQTKRDEQGQYETDRAGGSHDRSLFQLVLDHNHIISSSVHRRLKLIYSIGSFFPENAIKESESQFVTQRLHRSIKIIYRCGHLHTLKCTKLSFYFSDTYLYNWRQHQVFEIGDYSVFYVLIYSFQTELSWQKSQFPVVVCHPPTVHF